MFSPLQKTPEDQIFIPDADVKVVVVKWFQRQPSVYSEEVIHQLLHQWDACLSTHNDYL
jgi:hypothetical protein